MADIVTTSTTSTTIPPAPLPQPQYYDNWGVAKIILAGVIGAVMFFNGAAQAVEFVKNWFKHRKSEENEITAPLELRLKKVEDVSTTFRSADYLDKESVRLESKIDHNKRNSDQCFDQLTNMHRSMSQELIEAQRRLTKVETKVEGMESNISRVERAVEKLTDRVEERFDGLTDILSKK